MSKKTIKNSNAKKTVTASGEPTKAASPSGKPPKGSERGEAAVAPKAAAAKQNATKAQGARPKALRPIPPAPTAPAPAVAPTSARSARKDGRAPADTRDPRLPAVGTTLVKRDRLGRARCECVIEDGGIRYHGTLHRSLSAAASAAAADLGIKGRVNGFVFWGLVKTGRPAKNPAEHLRKIAARYEEQAATLLNAGNTPEVRNDVRRELEAHAAHVSQILTKSAA